MGRRYHLYRTTGQSVEQLIHQLGDALASQDLTPDLSQDRLSISIVYENPEECLQQIRSKQESFKSQGEHHQPSLKSLCLLFTGQGAQYPGMAKDLYQSVPFFKKSLDHYNTLLKQHCDIDCLPCLIGDSDEINKTLYTQPSLVIMQLALYDLLVALGVTGDMIIGHSVGEFSGSACAGFFSVDAVLKMIGKRATLMQSVDVEGSMIAVAADHDTIEALLREESIYLNYAAFNAPKQIVLAGKLTSIQKLYECCQKRRIKSRILVVSHPFHSELMQPVTDAFMHFCQTIPSLNGANTPLISNLTGKTIEQPQSPSYWKEHILRPVLFAQSVENAWQNGARLFLEIGPDAILSKLAKKCLIGKNPGLLAAQRRDQHGVDQLIRTLETLDASGVPVRWSQFLEFFNQ